MLAALLAEFQGRGGSRCRGIQYAATVVFRRSPEDDRLNRSYRPMLLTAPTTLLGSLLLPLLTQVGDPWNPAWSPDFYSNGLVRITAAPASVSHPDLLVSESNGSIPDGVYLSGNFSQVGGIGALGLARWDGLEWSSVGMPVVPAEGEGSESPELRELSYVFGSFFADGPTGVELCVLGNFNVGINPGYHLLCWDGLRWRFELPIGAVGQSPRSVAVREGHASVATLELGDGSRRGVYYSNHSNSNEAVEWDGATANVIGQFEYGDPLGLDNQEGVVTVGETAFFYGDIVSVDGVPVDGIAAWNGQSWSGLGAGMWAIESACNARIAGSEILVVASGAAFSQGFSSNVVTWDGLHWGELPNPGFMPEVIRSATLQGVDGLMASPSGGGQHWFYDGVGWSPIGLSLGGNGVVQDVATTGQAGSEQLVVAGRFGLLDSNGDHLDGIARFDGTDWLAMRAQGQGLWGYVGETGLLAEPELIVPHRINGTSVALVSFRGACGGSVPCGVGEVVFSGSGSQVAAWDGASWTSIPIPLGGSPRAMVSWDSGSGPELYAARSGSLIRQQSGNWIPWAGLQGSSGLGDPDVRELAVFDDGGGDDIYAIGVFTDGGSGNGFAQWDGQQWNGLSHPVFFHTTPDDMAVVESGPERGLYVLDRHFADVALHKWDGTAWTTVSLPANADDVGYRQGMCSVAVDGVMRLCILSGSGSGQATPRLLFHANSQWIAVELPILRTNEIARPRSIVSAPSGDALLVGGDFTTHAGGDASTVKHVSRVGRANGLLRYECDTGRFFAHDLGSFRKDIHGQVTAMKTLEIAGKVVTLIGGGFASVDGMPSRGLANYYPSANGEVIDVCLYRFDTGCPCPEFDSSLPRGGCVNSSGVRGRMENIGAPVLSQGEFGFSLEGLTGPALLIRGTNAGPNGGSVLGAIGPGNPGTLFGGGGYGTELGDGTLCVSGMLQRLSVASPIGGSATFDLTDMGAVAPGETYYYQAWYRDGDMSFCMPEGYNFTNALGVTFAP